jgi:3-hydroxyisobutyrate dehydrogenase-like beta-hydroxyacid dehydrogenase
MTRAGFIGLGSQGGPMARRIATEFPLTLWARRREALTPHADTGADIAPTPAALGAASDVVGICVVADADVEDVILRADGVLAGMSAGGVIAIHSTVHPRTCFRVAEEAARKGVSVIDAPVSGGGGAAAERQLLVMVGGNREAVDRARPILDTFADPLLHLGPLGSGQTAKLLNNIVFTAQITLALDTYALADALGMDRGAVAQVLAGGSGGSRAAAILAASGFDTTGLRSAASLLDKDLGIMLDVTRSREVVAPGTLVDLARRTLRTLHKAPAPE